MAVLLFAATLAGQGRQGSRGAAARRATAAPIDLTGYWVSVVTEDWRWRMLTPPKGDAQSVPINAEGKRVDRRLGPGERTTRPATSARRSASAASCVSPAGCTSRGRTTRR